MTADSACWATPASRSRIILKTAHFRQRHGCHRLSTSSVHKRESGSAAEKAKKAALDAKAQKDTEQVAFGFRFGTPS